MAQLYIHPAQNATAKLFLTDSRGKYIKWDSITLSNYNRNGRVVATKAHNGLAISLTSRYTNTCRETLCNSFYDFFNNLWLPYEKKITTVPPKTKSGRPLVKELSTFKLSIGGSLNGKKVWTRDGSMASTYIKAYNLSITKKSMTEVYELMDVLMGTAGMLMGGPGAYTRTLVSKNPVKVAKSRVDSFYAYSSLGLSEHGTTKVVKNTLEYTGLSNFWMEHPASFSILMGLSRMALELWFDDKYEAIDNEMDIPSLRRWLAEMSKKKKFTPKDKKELVEVLTWFNPYFNCRKVGNNLGAYPITKHTFDMFLKYADVDHSVGTIPANWKGPARSYGLASYGFYTWCTRQVGDAQTPAFKKRPQRKCWGGLNGNRIAFGGH
jgi:hypothetical protein